MHPLKEIRHECSRGRDIVTCSHCILLGLVVFLLDPPLWNSLDQPASQNDPGYIISLIFNLKNSFSDSSDISVHVHTHCYKSRQIQLSQCVKRWLLCLSWCSHILTQRPTHHHVKLSSISSVEWRVDAAWLCVLCVISWERIWFTCGW